jgi:hypothetical protein
MAARGSRWLCAVRILNRGRFLLPGGEIILALRAHLRRAFAHVFRLGLQIAEALSKSPKASFKLSPLAVDSVRIDVIVFES